MSMVRCERCEVIIDCKAEGIEGIHGESEPWEYLCPRCVDAVAEEHRIGEDDGLEYQDQRIIQAFRHPEGPPLQGTPRDRFNKSIGLWRGPLEED